MRVRSRRSVSLFRIAFGALVLAGASPAQPQDVIISEFVAGNATGLIDEDGDAPDWIEIFNASGAAVSLEGWFLTDNPDRLTKWPFPAVELAPGQFLVVFASEKNRKSPDKPLHTNFRLETFGEFLALVRPDGQTFASLFAPRYSTQRDDASFGVRMESESQTLLADKADLRYFIPANDDLAQTWTAPEFDDSAWTAARSALGYDRKTGTPLLPLVETNVELEMYRNVTSIFTRIPFDVAGAIDVDVLLLKMRYDDGFIAYLNGVEVARADVPANVVWNTRATVSRTDAAVMAAAEFEISAHAGLLVPGRNVLAVHALNVTTSNTDFLILPEIEAQRVTAVRTDVMENFPQPTPGRPNAGGLSGIVAMPKLSQASGTFTEAFVLELTCDTPGAAIHYTLDRRQPTAESPVYTGPLNVNAQMVIKAAAFADGMVASDVAHGVYFFVDRALSGFSSNLPIVFAAPMSAPGGETYVPTEIAFLENPDGRTLSTTPPEFIGLGAMKRRGSSSGGWPKGNYGLELHDHRGEDIDVSILGLPADSDWVLHGPYSDKSLMRNYLAYKWSNDIGRYATRTRFFELFLNVSRSPSFSMAHYAGVYLLVEKIKRGDERVDVSRLYSSENDETSISGGYLLKKDRNDPGDAGFPVPGGTGFAAQTLLFVTPKENGPGSASPEQKAWIRSFFAAFAGALSSPNFMDPVDGYAKYIDVGSFIDHHILVEICKNIDGYRLSTFMFKDRDGKLNMGPVWDYNLSLRNADYLEGWIPQGWYYRLVGAGDYPWYARLFTDPAFRTQYSDRWMEVRRDQFTVARLMGDIDDTTSLLAEGAARNFEKWRNLGTYLWPNPSPLARTHQEEVDMMKSWLLGRVVWMDDQLIPAPIITPAGGEITPGLMATIEGGPTGTLYYTLDGTDPRLPNGTRAPQAKLYTGPVPITQNAIVKARVLPETIGGGALREAFFIQDVPPLVVTELMINPLPPEDGSPYSATDFEFIEIHNAGDRPVDLTGARITKGVTFSFDQGSIRSLEPGQYAVIVRNPEAFATRYDTFDITVAGEFSGSFSNRGEDVEIIAAIDENIRSFALVAFRFDSAWAPSVETEGYSLVLTDPTLPRHLHGDGSSWRASFRVHGSPGKPDLETLPAGLQRPGDLTQDGRVHVGDAVGLLKVLFQGATALPCDGGLASAGNRALLDHNGDGAVNLSDVVGVLNFLYLRGPSPALGGECVTIEGCPDVCSGS